MKYISHRGNTVGKNEETENNPAQIIKTLEEGFDVEIDVWYINQKFFLGHDEPKYEVDETFLEKENLWCHAKNIDSLLFMLKNSKIHCFWHEKDTLTLTSRNYIWAYPGNQPLKNSIAVMPELYNDNIKLCSGICSDNIKFYFNDKNNHI